MKHKNQSSTTVISVYDKVPTGSVNNGYIADEAKNHSFCEKV